jgi:hypothetical protein
MQELQNQLIALAAAAELAAPVDFRVWLLHYANTLPAVDPADAATEALDAVPGATQEPFAVDPATGEKYEKDTAEEEEVLDLTTLVLPHGVLPAEQDFFAVSYNTALLHGWVKQPSPCCAAASVAGAWNALAGRCRDDALAFSHTTVIEALAATLREQIASKRARFERMLGAALEPLFTELSSVLHAAGRSLGGSKECGAPRAYVLRHIRAIVQQNYDASSAVADAASTDAFATATASDSDVYARLGELYAAEPVEQDEDPAALVTNDNEDDVPVRSNDADADDSSAAVNAIPEGEDECAIDEELADFNNIATSSNGSNKGRRQSSGTGRTAAAAAAAAAKPWLWKRDLWEMLKQTGGLEKLTAARASTAAFGNVGVMRAVDWLSERAAAACTDASADNTTATSSCATERVSARLFMGRKRGRGGLDVPLSPNDSDALIEQQWHALRSGFLTDQQVLLFHLKNHYALVFALREWRQPGGGWTRQLLTSRRGQRPSAWVDFTEARHTMLGWDGYKMLALTRVA